MSQPDPPSRLRFDSFELDLRTRELRKDGRPIKLQDQPIKLLALLASRAGELVTRAEIEKALWGEDQFVEFEHGINTAMRKIREALGDDLENPRFIETLPRKGYRFIASLEAGAMERTEAKLPSNSADPVPPLNEVVEGNGLPPIGQSDPPPASEPALEVEFALPRGVARALFLTTQVGYLAMYCAALYLAEDLQQALERVLMVPSGIAMPFVIVIAMCGIAVRLYLLSSVGLNHPAAGAKFRMLFPAVFVLDTFWAASPLLLARKMGYGLALGSVAALAYLPFSQRTLMVSIYRNRKSPSSKVSPA